MAPKDYSSYLKLERINEEKKILELIQLYRSCECLWNPQSPEYDSASVKEDAWRQITCRLDRGLTPDQVKLQVLALRNYYDKECAAIEQSQIQGHIYVPRRSYFQALHFLSDPSAPMETNESKVSFCMRQVESILDVALMMGEKTNQNAGYSPNISEETIRLGSASSLSIFNPSSSEPQANYTFYTLILEPEHPSLESRGKIKTITERPASGSERWYPTSYCVQCGSAAIEGPCDPWGNCSWARTWPCNHYQCQPQAPCLPRPCDPRLCETFPCHQHPCDQRPCDQRPCDQRPCDQRPCDQRPCDQRPCDQRPCDQRSCDQHSCDQCTCDPRPCNLLTRNPLHCNPRSCDHRSCDPRPCKPLPCNARSCDPRSCDPRPCNPLPCNPLPCNPRSCDPRPCKPRSCDHLPCNPRSCDHLPCNPRPCDPLPCPSRPSRTSLSRHFPSQPEVDEGSTCSWARTAQCKQPPMQLTFSHAESVCSQSLGSGISGKSSSHIQISNQCPLTIGKGRLPCPSLLEDNAFSACSGARTSSCCQLSCQNKGTYVDMCNCDSCVKYRQQCDWPRPRLCDQVQPRCRFVPSDIRRKGCCSGNWKKNNDMMCRRLQTQLNKPCRGIRRTAVGYGNSAFSINGRYRSGEDQPNVMLLKSKRHAKKKRGWPINCKCPIYLNPITNNLGGPDPCTIHKNKSIPDPIGYINNQSKYAPSGYTNNKSKPVPNGYNNNQSMPAPNGYNNNQSIPDPSGYHNNQSIPLPNGYTNNQTIPYTCGCMNNQAFPDPNGYTNNQSNPYPCSCANNQAIPDPNGYTNNQSNPYPCSCANNQAIPDPNGYTNNQSNPYPCSCMNNQAFPDPNGYTNNQSIPYRCSCVNNQAFPDPNGYTNNQAIPDPNGYTNNQPIPYPCSCVNNQAISDPNGYNNNQSMPEPDAGLRNTDECQCECINQIQNCYCRRSFDTDQMNSQQPELSPANLTYPPVTPIKTELNEQSIPFPLLKEFDPSVQPQPRIVYCCCNSDYPYTWRQNPPQNSDICSSCQRQFNRNQERNSPPQAASLLKDPSEESKTRFQNDSNEAINAKRPDGMRSREYEEEPYPQREQSNKELEETTTSSGKQGFPSPNRHRKEYAESQARNSPPQEAPLPKDTSKESKRFSQNDSIEEINAKPPDGMRSREYEEEPYPQGEQINNQLEERTTRSRKSGFPSSRRPQKKYAESQAINSPPQEAPLLKESSKESKRFSQNDSIEEINAKPPDPAGSTVYEEEPPQREQRNKDLEERRNRCGKPGSSSTRSPRREHDESPARRIERNGDSSVHKRSGQRKEDQQCQPCGFTKYNGNRQTKSPALNRQSPKASPKIRREEPNRSTGRSKPSSRDEEYEKSPRGSSSFQSGLEAQYEEPQSKITSKGTYEEEIQSPRSMRRTNDPTPTSRQSKAHSGRTSNAEIETLERINTYCDDETCPKVSRYGRQGKDHSQRTHNPNSNYQSYCNDETCPNKRRYSRPENARSPRRDPENTSKQKYHVDTSSHPRPTSGQGNIPDSSDPENQSKPYYRNVEPFSDRRRSPGQENARSPRSANQDAYDLENKNKQNKYCDEKCPYRRSTSRHGKDRLRRTSSQDFSDFENQRKPYSNGETGTNGRHYSRQENARSQRTSDQDSFEPETKNKQKYCCEKCPCRRPTSRQDRSRRPSNQDLNDPENKNKSYHCKSETSPNGRHYSRQENARSQRTSDQDSFEPENKNKQKYCSEKCPCRRPTSRQDRSRRPSNQDLNDPDGHRYARQMNARSQRTPNQDPIDSENPNKQFYGDDDIRHGKDRKGRQNNQDNESYDDYIDVESSPYGRPTSRQQSAKYSEDYNCRCDTDYESSKRIKAHGKDNPDRYAVKPWESDIYESTYSDTDESMECRCGLDETDPKLINSTRRSRAGSGFVSLKPKVIGKMTEQNAYSVSTRAHKPGEIINKFKISCMAPSKPMLKGANWTEGPTQCLHYPNYSLSSRKKLLCSKGALSKNDVTSRAVSRTRRSGAEKTQEEEDKSKNPSPRSRYPSPQGRSIAWRRDHDPANSKLPLHNGLAPYYIRKLQDHDSANKYLVVVPKKASDGPDFGHRLVPGQGSAKQPHCSQRQSSGFQSVSWVPPEFTHQSRLSWGCLGLNHINRPLMEWNVDPLPVGKADPVPRPGPLPLKIRRKILCKPRKPVLRPSYKANTKILNENRTVLLTNKTPLDSRLRDVIVLHPPVPGFRASRHSFGTDELEVQHNEVRNSGTLLSPGQPPKRSPVPPTPPAKPKRKPFL